ncbi:MAG: hypothetical protein CMJ75_18295 [Planctomycetaceae bacterium]|nr:hypothetical protein [Planctomycetaceae bacterium]
MTSCSCGSLPALLLAVALLASPAGAAAPSSPAVASPRIAFHQEDQAPAEPPRERDHREHEPTKDDRIGLVIALSINAVVITLIIAIVLIVRRVQKKRAEKRTADLQVVAADLKLEFRDRGDASLQQALSAFPLFSIGRARKLTNLFVADTPDLKINLFDYQYTTGHGKHKRIRRQTVAAVQSQALTVPDFVMRPEGRLDRVGSLLGRQDIDFDDHPAFSKAFVLQSTVESETREFFDTTLLDYFAEHGTISFEAAAGTFLYFRRWQYVAAETEPLRDFLGEGYQAYQAIQERLERHD